MRDVNDLPEDIAGLANKAKGIRKNNSLKIAHLERTYPIDVNVILARMEHFMGALVDAGVISEEFYWATALDWEESLQRQLHEMEVNLKERVRQEREAQRRAVSESLALPDKPKLIVPGQE